ncbi:hypothetical protein WJX73_008311 [Symbiochloris irregularis]|uniref:Uncharacterized protein n=1 Tax=Symbiochloris irregularis TaxID=706552 RepID=A0AAW1PBL1_9CHLO
MLVCLLLLDTFCKWHGEDQNRDRGQREADAAAAVAEPAAPGANVTVLGEQAEVGNSSSEGESDDDQDAALRPATATATAPANSGVSPATTIARGGDVPATTTAAPLRTSVLSQQNILLGVASPPRTRHQPDAAPARRVSFAEPLQPFTTADTQLPVSPLTQLLSGFDGATQQQHAASDEDEDEAMEESPSADVGSDRAPAAAPRADSEPPACFREGRLWYTKDGVLTELQQWSVGASERDLEYANEADGVREKERGVWQFIRGPEAWAGWESAQPKRDSGGEPIPMSQYHLWILVDGQKQFCRLHTADKAFIAFWWQHVGQSANLLGRLARPTDLDYRKTVQDFCFGVKNAEWTPAEASFDGEHIKMRVLCDQDDAAWLAAAGSPADPHPDLDFARRARLFAIARGAQQAQAPSSSSPDPSSGNAAPSLSNGASPAPSAAASPGTSGRTLSDPHGSPLESLVTPAVEDTSVPGPCTAEAARALAHMGASPVEPPACIPPAPSAIERTRPVRSVKVPPRLQE